VSDSTERYYAEMESARNATEDAYFKARPSLGLGTPAEMELWRTVFRAGFERGFRYLWDLRAANPTDAAP
jgi:hypothetical protein